MALVKEIREILSFLESRKDYVIFAGFAAYIYTGIKASKDIDIFVNSFSNVDVYCEILKDFGWNEIKRIKDDKKRYHVCTLIKNGTTFDICYSLSSKKVFVQFGVKKKFENFNLRLISLEGLYLTKVSQITFLRPEIKTKRDREVINILRERISVSRLKKMIFLLPEIFWKEGR